MQRDHRSAGVLPAKRYDLPKFEELNSTPRNPTTTPPALAREEQIFMEQLAHLNMHRDFRKTLVDARKCTERAREVAPLLSQEREKKVEIAHIRAQEEQRLMAEAEIAAQRQAEEKKKADTLSRIRMRKLKDQLREERKLFALAHETARRRDEARAKANSAQRQAQELKARKERANRATAKLAAMRDAFNREKAARDQEEKNQLCARFTLYDAKWEALKGPDELPPLYFKQLPWPILADINTADEITLQAMKTFIFHPERLSPIGKSPKERLRLELLKWHPDKFNAKILGRIAQEQQAHVQEAAGRVARFLNEMLAEVEAGGDMA
ncbi:hypothetical protein BD779DRAFT_1452527 [Infundibulicybe gibba]|nr:hypothetical protein BD779DRAFT_1452527 [Infundibulicybe gibba]